VDQGLTPAVEEDSDSLELFNQNNAARNAVRHVRCELIGSQLSCQEVPDIK